MLRLYSARLTIDEGNRCYAGDNPGVATCEAARSIRTIPKICCRPFFLALMYIYAAAGMFAAVYHLHEEFKQIGAIFPSFAVGSRYRKIVWR